MLPELIAQIEQFQIGIRQLEQRSGLSCIQHAHLPSTRRDHGTSRALESGGFYQAGSLHRCKKSRRRIAQIWPRRTKAHPHPPESNVRQKQSLLNIFKYLKKHPQKEQ
ncbi:hypothetical protein [Methyloversatilis discipulorum]|uniref:hypothetical protein n=1 Tax=Methyloversatilis discipulorum TaxID=1119528 RepID=UPI001A486B9E|nr:hypothetical protein [Methyloversatilis discipulorum]MBL8469025.1 hypothetical protein [Methyloversatilis discipulorum]